MNDRDIGWDKLHAAFDNVRDDIMRVKRERDALLKALLQLLKAVSLDATPFTKESIASLSKELFDAKANATATLEIILGK